MIHNNPPRITRIIRISGDFISVNVAYLMGPDGSKYGSFSLQNNRGGAKLLTERIVSAIANYLFLKCPGIAQTSEIPNTSATTLSLMEHFETADDLANADLEKAYLLDITPLDFYGLQDKGPTT